MGLGLLSVLELQAENLSGVNEPITKVFEHIKYTSETNIEMQLYFLFTMLNFIS